MSKNTCATCQEPKATLNCNLCNCDICKGCALLIDDEAFAFLPDGSQEHDQHLFCVKCFDENITPKLDSYNQTMALAKDVNVFFKARSKITRAVNRQEPPVQVIDCEDYDEAILRMAFLAAQSKFNTLVDVDMVSKKVRVNNYKTTIWSGSGIPTNVQPAHVERLGNMW